MGENRKKRKGIPTNVEDFKEKRNLNQQELREYIGIVTLCNNQKWRAMQIANNTALIPRGKEIAKEEEAISNLLENAKNNWIAQVLKGCGVLPGQAVNINSHTGVIEYAKTNMEKEKSHIEVDKKTGKAEVKEE